MEEKEENQGNLEVGVKVSDKVLSMKAKGAGVLVLLFISISGMIFVSYIIYDSDGKNFILYLPLLFLLFVTYQLINLAHALFRTGFYIDTE